MAGALSLGPERSGVGLRPLHLHRLVGFGGDTVSLDPLAGGLSLCERFALPIYIYIYMYIWAVWSVCTAGGSRWGDPGMQCLLRIL